MPPIFFERIFEPSRNPKKVGSKPERGKAHRVFSKRHKRAAKAQRDLFRKRRSKEAGERLIFCRRQKKPEQSELCSDVVREMGLEPTLRRNRLLRPARLPFRHSRITIFTIPRATIFGKKTVK